MSSRQSSSSRRAGFRSLWKKLAGRRSDTAISPRTPQATVRALFHEPLEARALLATFHVALTGLDTNTGGIGDPFRTIQAAVTAASTTSDGNDVINVATGTYNAAGVDQRFDIVASGKLDNPQLLGGWNTAFTLRQSHARTIVSPASQ